MGIDFSTNFKNSPNHYMAIIWAFIYYTLFGNSSGLNICGMWVLPQFGSIPSSSGF
jgi:hypothetical protein